MKKKRLTWLLIGCITPALLFMLLVGIAIQNIQTRVSGKTMAGHRRGLIEVHRELAEITPEKQWESDTCGMHTLRAIYRAYGLDPDEENLRVRLGLDVPSNPLDGSSTGTVQPDMLRVLVQDGFQYQCPGMMVGESTRRHAAFRGGSGTGFIGIDDLVYHLEGGNMAAVLIRRPETGAMHWVAAYKLIDGQIEIIDSLTDEAYRIGPQSLWDEQLLSFILVQPAGQRPSQEMLDRTRIHGVRDMAFSVRRLRILQVAATESASALTDKGTN